jgi:hypothetical protein
MTDVAPVKDGERGVGWSGWPSATSALPAAPSAELPNPEGELDGKVREEARDATTFWKWTERPARVRSMDARGWSRPEVH